MKSFLVVANLKMNLSSKQLIPYLNKVNSYSKNNLVICPTSIYIPYFLKHSYKVGIQNVFYENEGSYTGEISPFQASSLGIEYAIVGHSNRRILFHETDLEIHKKIVKCLENKLKVVVCIGETLEEKNRMKTSSVLKKQIMMDLRGIQDLSNVYIAYEPVWAIGSKQVPSNQDIKDTVNYIKELVAELNQYENIKVLYGGSIDEENIELITKISNIDGILIGNSALNAEQLLTIMRKCK